MALGADAVRVADNRSKLRIVAENATAIDTFVFLGPNDTPGSVDIDVTFKAFGPVMELGSGDDVPPTDPAAFLGRFREARAVGHISGRELGFKFEPKGAATTDVTWAEVGVERNGAFL